MVESVSEVTQSYYRCRRSEDFLDSFYSLFLAKSPAIASMFANTDFKLQKLMLRQSLLEMICFARGMDGTSEEIERLSAKHRQLDVPPEMYSMWLDSLCEAVSKHDPEFTQNLEMRWRETMSPTIEKMIEAGKQSPDS